MASSTILRQRNSSNYFSNPPYRNGPPITQPLRWPENPSFVIGSLIIPKKPTVEGVLVKSYAAIWVEFAKLVAADWTLHFKLSRPSGKRWLPVLSAKPATMKWYLRRAQAIMDATLSPRSKAWEHPHSRIS